MYNHEDVLKHLSSKDKEELAMWEGLIAHPGFRLLVQRLSEQVDSAVAVISNAPNWDAYTYARGIRDSLSGVINLETLLEFSVQEKLEAAMEAQTNEVSEDYI